MFGIGHRYTVRPNDDGLVFGMSPVILFSMAIFVTMMLLVFRTPPVQKLSNKKLLKSVKGNLFVGVYHDLLPAVVLQSLDTMNQQYGKIYDLFVFSKHFIVLSDIKLCNEVLLQIPGLFHRATSTGDSSLSVLKLDCDVISDEINRIDVPYDQSLTNSFVDRLIVLSKDGNSVDAKEELFQFVRTIVVRKVLNFVQTDSDLNDYFQSTQLTKDIHAINAFTQPYLFSLPFYTWRRLPHMSVLEATATEANHRLTAMCKDVVTKKLIEFNQNDGVSGADTSVLNTLLVHLKESKSVLVVPNSDSSASSSKRVSRHSTIKTNTAEMEIDKLVATVKNRLLHQCDSSVTALCGVLLHLSQSSEALSRLRNELETLCSQEAITTGGDIGAQNVSPFTSSSNSSIAQLTELQLQRISPSSLPFTTAVLKEATRLSPAVPYFSVESKVSRSIEEVKLSNGLIIKTDDELVLHLDQLVWNEVTFTDSRAFHPTRWLTRNKDALGNMEMAYASHQRAQNVAQGMEAALSHSEMLVVMCSLVHRLDFTLDCPVVEIKRVVQWTAGPDKLPMTFSLRR